MTPRIIASIYFSEFQASIDPKFVSGDFRIRLPHHWKYGLGRLIPQHSAYKSLIKIIKNVF